MALVNKGYGVMEYLVVGVAGVIRGFPLVMMWCYRVTVVVVESDSHMLQGKGYSVKE
jgi:hypothetical protein